MTAQEGDTSTRRLTPQGVLEVLKGLCSQLEKDNGHLPLEELSFDTTVDAWLLAMNAGRWDWDELHTLLYWLFDTDFSERDCIRVLTPYEKRTLRGVCELIASKAAAPELKPVRMLGKECAPAGAFLALRSALAEAGVDVSYLSPSTLVAWYFAEYPEQMFREIVRLGPGEVKVHGFSLRNRLRDVSLNVCVYSFLATFVSGALCIKFPWARYVLVPSVVLLTISVLVDWCSALRKRRGVEAEGVRDFRDLSYLLVGEKPPLRHAKPV